MSGRILGSPANGFTDVEVELANLLRDEISQQIDREIIEMVRQQDLMARGWHKVPPWYESRSSIPWHDEKVAAWLSTNCRGQHERFSTSVVFADLADAVAFAMVWN